MEPTLNSKINASPVGTVASPKNTEMISLDHISEINDCKSPNSFEPLTDIQAINKMRAQSIALSTSEHQILE